jgi:hypothetical protein
MIKSLKVVLIIYGAISAVMGVMHIFAPDLLTAMMGLGEMPAACSPALYAMAMVGISFIAGGVYLIVAGTRDIIRHIYWVQFAILWAILAVAAGLYSVMRGYVTFEQVMMPIILDAVFAVALLALYPYRAVRSAARRRK